MSYVKRGLSFLGYAYLLRVPLLTWAILLTLAWGSLQGSFAEPILRGIFDVGSRQSGALASVVEFAAVTMAALLAGTSMGVSARLVVCNGHMRFDAAPVSISAGIELLFRLLPLAAFLAVVGRALYLSTALWQYKLPGVVIGIYCWYVVTVGAEGFFNSIRSPRVLRWRAGMWVPPAEKGYLSTSSGTLQSRHLFAAYQFVLALVFYLLYCAFSAFDLAFFRGQMLIPALALVMTLCTIFCWGLSGISFYLDAYRIPLLLPLFALTFFTGFFKQGDYFYEGLPLPASTGKTPTAAQMIEAYSKSAESDTPLILVATTGGGIQAAGWTARVLTGLNESVTVDKGGVRKNFSHYLRLISSVSGGSVGAMYFLDRYRNGAVDDAASKDIVANAQKSSLDEVTWGLAYPDLLFQLVPFFMGGGVSAGRVHFNDSGFIYMDRGRMLETSWRNRMSDVTRDATLAQWRDDAAVGKRPAVIFNSTLVETGYRYLLATTGFTEGQQYGRREFFAMYPKSDISVRTAARLSATFPYVTPAARMLRDGEKPPEGRFYSPEPHAVDGGYYDNYGMVSLLDWLNSGLEAVPARPRVLIIEIHASPTEEKPKPESSVYGGIFQLTNPLITIANVRGTGQVSHNNLDKTLINRVYSPCVHEITFEFKATDKRGCRRNEPLNWHLTQDDVSALDDAWQAAWIQQAVQEVRDYLKEGGTCLTE